MDQYPKRKPIRIENYDSSAPGAYFITICTANREKLFWNGVGADRIRPYGVNGGWFYETLGFPSRSADQFGRNLFMTMESGMGRIMTRFGNILRAIL